MFRTIDNVTMVKAPTGDLSWMKRIESLRDGRRPSYNGSNPRDLHALRAGAAGWCTAAPCPRPQPGLDRCDAVRPGELPRARAIYTEVKLLLEFIVAGGLATTVKAGLQLPGVGVGDPRRRLLPLDDEARTALKKLLTDGWSQRPVRHGFRPLQLRLRVTCVARRKNYRSRNVFAIFQHSHGVRDLRLLNVSARRTPFANG
jgi:dihydrodipicolinate synthase/N-acetylneuraminate lyase